MQEDEITFKRLYNKVKRDDIISTRICSFGLTDGERERLEYLNRKHYKGQVSKNQRKEYYFLNIVYEFLQQGADQQHYIKDIEVEDTRLRDWGEILTYVLLLISGVSILCLIFDKEYLLGRTLGWLSIPFILGYLFTKKKWPS